MKSLDLEVESSGDLLVKVRQDSHSRALMHLKNISCNGVTFPVSVQAHRSLNSTKGVVRSVEFKLFDEENDIVEVLSSQGVTHAKRMSFMKDGIASNRNSHPDLQQA